MTWTAQYLPRQGLEFSRCETEGDERVGEVVAGPSGGFRDVGEAKQAQRSNRAVAHDCQDGGQRTGSDRAAVFTSVTPMTCSRWGCIRSADTTTFVGFSIWSSSGTEAVIWPSARVAQ